VAKSSEGVRAVVVAVISLLIGVGIGYVLFKGSEQPAKNKVDSKTNASPQKPPLKLPEPGKTYEVLGAFPGLQKFAVKYDQDFFRGGELQAIEGAEALQRWGVKTIVSVCPTDLERLLCEKFKFKLVELPFEKTDLKASTVNKFLEVMNTTEKPVYVHCHGGTHRGGLFGFIYRVQVQKWDVDKASKEYAVLGGDPANKDKGMVDAALKHLGKNK